MGAHKTKENRLSREHFPEWKPALRGKFGNNTTLKVFMGVKHDIFAKLVIFSERIVFI